MKRVLITGGNFRNKGAQAMLFITACEARKRFADAEIYFSSPDKYDKKKFSQYSMEQINRDSLVNAFRYKTNKIGFGKFAVRSIRNLMVNTLKRKTNGIDFLDIKCCRYIETFDAVIDISGYALADTFTEKGKLLYLDMISCASQMGIPVVVMPQSFGPIKMDGGSKVNREYIRASLKSAKIIFAREQDGYDFLVNDIQLDNVQKSVDLVLQNTCIQWNLIRKKEMPQIEMKTIKEHSVAIIPNQKIITATENSDIYDVYQTIIDQLLEWGKNVYLLRHSNEDKAICHHIKELYKQEASVVLVDEEWDCFEYEKYVEKFDYIVASRYHSTVIAYKKRVPVLGIGWANKYQELFKACAQEKYILDARKELNIDDLLIKLCDMNTYFAKESGIIDSYVREIQKNNCFEEGMKFLLEEER